MNCPRITVPVYCDNSVPEDAKNLANPEIIRVETVVVFLHSILLIESHKIPTYTWLRRAPGSDDIVVNMPIAEVVDLVDKVDPPAWEAPTRIFTCEKCGKRFSVGEGLPRKSRRYCSDACRSQAWRDRMLLQLPGAGGIEAKHAEAQNAGFVETREMLTNDVLEDLKQRRDSQPKSE